jgi:hypothetical protein
MKQPFFMNLCPETKCWFLKTLVSRHSIGNAAQLKEFATKLSVCSVSSIENID